MIETASRKTRPTGPYTLCYILFILLYLRPDSLSSTATETKDIRLDKPWKSYSLGQTEKHIHDISSFVNSLSGDNNFSSDYVITHPTRVNHNGEFVSHKVRYISENPTQNLDHRKRRSINSDSPGQPIFFKVNVGNRDVTLNLTENKRLAHSNFIVERLRGDPTKEQGFQDEQGRHSSFPPHRSSIQRGTNWPCHFRGHVVGQVHLVAALSTCNGLTGFIRLSEGDYFIEPLAKLHKDHVSSKSQPHKIYKRNIASRKLFDEDSTPPLKSLDTDHESTYVQSRRRRKGNRHRTEHNSHKKKENSNSFRSSKDSRRWENVMSEFAGKEFCGVKDTKRQYHRDLRSRYNWEKRQRNKYSFKRSKDRKRRSLSLEHWVEMMVVVDSKMVEYYEIHQEDDVERYVLTIINMVSGLFHDVSIGNSLHVTLIRLILLEGEESGIKIGSHAENTLDSFCKWAKRMNPSSDTHAHHHDVAVLLTRKNICSNSNKSCETLGLAHVAGMCQSHRSCNVNQDTGLSVAFTVAHELGHNFAMHHDGHLNNCQSGETQPRVMSPHLTSNNLPMQWSPCSRRYITRFLDRNWGFCLMDAPSTEHNEFDFPSHLPGVLYNADHQCRLMFGPKSKHCNGIDDICNRLWCFHEGSCRSRLHAAVSGTKCDKARWCYDGRCVSVGKRPTSVDGGWGSWSKWSRCSRSCGIGITYSARFCNQPAPRHGGRYCLGVRRRYRTCNLWKCPQSNTNLTFREEQCAEFNNILYRNHTYLWLPVESAVYPCELHCYTSNSKTPFADRLRDKVVDGTKCFNLGKDICVDGICKQLGCDLKIDSFAREDKCGVCRGDGSTCTEVESSFTLEIGDEYEQVGLLPKGARNIKIFETESSRNFLALKSTLNEDEYYLNGKYMIQWDTTFDLAGTKFTYQRINTTQDNITAEGPLLHDVMIMVLFIENNPGIHISYVMPHNVTAVLSKSEEPPLFKWMMQPWTHCSKTCGRGIQMSSAICIERKAGIVEEDFCDIESRLSDRRRICVNPTCPPEWLTGPWQPCPITCGSEIGQQKRTVLCIRNINDGEQIVLNKTKCNKSTQPTHLRSCVASNQFACPSWRVGSWGSCSVPCGKGFRNRAIECVTRVNNDIISIDEEDIGSIENEYADSSLQYHGVGIPGQKQLSTSDKITILHQTDQRNRERNKETEFDIKNEMLCNVTLKPPAEEACNLRDCANVGSSVVDEFDTHSSADQEYSNSAMLNLRYENYNKTNSVLDELDTEDDIKQLHQTSNLLLLNSSNGGPVNIDVFSTFISSQSITPSANVSAPNNFSDSNFNFEMKKRIIQKISSSMTTHQVDDNGSGSGEESHDTVTTNASFLKHTNSSYKWLTEPWGACSTSCGVGAQTRNVTCNKGPGQCEAGIQPAPVQRCNLRPCASWQYGSWSKCSRLCGRGHKQLKVHCRNSRTNELLRPYHCNSQLRLPTVNKTCNVQRCLPWKTSRWSMCNVACGIGIQRRRIACAGGRESLCNVLQKPVHVKSCMPGVCVEWRTSRWKRCSVNCGNGLKRRLVSCVETDTGKSSDSCNPELKPDDLKKCNRGPCRVTDFDFSSCTGDRLTRRFCQVLKHWGKCVQPSLAIQCCSTCKTFLSVRRKDKIS